ncbi:MAG: HD-GYP domain-containing protein [Patescibacteria group bacterium]
MERERKSEDHIRLLEQYLGYRDLDQLYDIHTKLEQRSFSKYIIPLREIYPGLSLIAQVRDIDMKTELLLDMHRDHNEWLPTHAAHTGYLAQRFAAMMGTRDPHMLRRIGRAGILHDIGKIGISNTIWNSTHKHGRPEIDARRLHTEFGILYAYYAGIQDPVILQGIGMHHEKILGQGYPRRRTDKDLTYTASLVSMPDITQTLLGGRPYDPLPKGVNRNMKIMLGEVLESEIRKEYAYAYERIVPNQQGTDFSIHFWHPHIPDVHNHRRLPPSSELIAFNRYASEYLAVDPRIDLRDYILDSYWYQLLEDDDLL